MPRVLRRRHATACMLDDVCVEALAAAVTLLRCPGYRLGDLAEIGVDGFLHLAAPQSVLDLGRDIGGELDDLIRSCRCVLDRIVGRLNPDHPAVLADPLVFRRLIFATPQRVPERPIGRAVALCRARRTCCDACPGSPSSCSQALSGNCRWRRGWCRPSVKWMTACDFWIALI